MSDKKFTVSTIILSAVILLCMGIFIYVWDPCNYYRIKDNRLKYVASAYIDAGIIRNAEYDTAIIGSSMSQNFDMQLFRDKLNINPVKINTGGITLEQRDLFYDAVENTNKADYYYIEIALTKFNEDMDTLEDTPVYMYDDNQWNDFKYLFGYETWLRAVPISLAYAGLDALNLKIKTMHNLENVDYVGDWYYRSETGSEIVKSKYLSGVDAVSVQNLDGMYERMMENVDAKLTTIIEEDNKYVFYFPPYSALFWHDSDKRGCADIYYAVKEHILEILLRYPNVKVFDFQYAPFICDLDHYKDTTHYNKDINDFMVDCFANSTYIVTEMNYKEGISELKRLVDSFKNSNTDWLLE